MKKNVILFLILLLGFMLRIYGINWDQGYHLHPDERFLTMAANVLKIPSDWTTYFIPSLSSLNPYNLGYRFFVYGTFPLTIAKLFSILLRFDNYHDFTLSGRLLSALADTIVIFLVYKIVLLWEKKLHFDERIKFFASFLYAIAVLPIQLSHFFAVDTFLNLFMIASFYYAVKYAYACSIRYAGASALFFGFALGTKITAVYILPLILFFIIMSLIKKKQWMVFLRICAVFICIVYITVRIADPKFFATGNIFNPKLNPLFVQNLKELSEFSKKDVWYPPTVQWIAKPPVVFSLINIAFFGLGIPYFLLMLIGAYHLARKRNIGVFALFVWMAVFFLYQSSRFAATMRYFIFLYPFFALWAGFGLAKMLSQLQFKQIPSLDNPKKYRMPHFFGFHVSRHLLKVWSILLVLILLIWPYSFMSIYSRIHSRVTASKWMARHIPRTAYLAEEHWDDFLPVDGGYEGVQLPVFDPDTAQKWKIMNEILAKADYYVITSNRGYESMPTAPRRYPRMTQFYRDLFAGRLAFKKIAEFTSYPTLRLGFADYALYDDWAEEAFTVYDHPKVIIFKKTQPWTSIN